MDFGVLFLVISVVIFIACAFYFNNRGRALLEQEKLNVTLLETESREKEEIERQKKASDEHAVFVVKQSEELANELISELQRALGLQAVAGQTVLPQGQHLEVDLVTMKDKVKQMYSTRIQQLLTQLQDYQVMEAKKFKEFEEQEEANTDINLQKEKLEILEKTRLRMDEYKKQEIALFDAKVKKVVQEAAQDLLGHALTNGEREDLILQAVKAAKERNGI